MTDNCEARECPLMTRVEALEEESRHNKEAHKDFYEKLEKSHTSVAVIEERLEQIKQDTAEIKSSVQTLREKPAKRWEGLVEKALWAVCAAVIAFLLGRVGL